jgi:hypothetical protein
MIAEIFVDVLSAYTEGLWEVAFACGLASMKQITVRNGGFKSG